MSRWHLAGVTVLVACAGGTASEGRTSPAAVGRRDEILTIGAHNEILQVATGERLTFAATQSGVIVYDALFRSWLPPFAAPQEVSGNATALAADPTEDAMWLGMPRRIIYYRPRLDYAVSSGLPGTPDEIFFDRQDLGAGAYIRLGNRFVRVPRANAGLSVPVSAVPPPEQRLRSPTARDVFREYPSLESFLPLLTRGDDLEQWPASAATLAPGRSEVWLGTRGNGLLRVDPTFNRAEHLPFGLLERGVGALAPAADGVWIAGLGAPGERNGLVFTSSDLQQWRWVDGPPSRPFAGARVNALSVRERTAWIGTNRGLLRVDLDDDRRVDRWDATEGLPSDVIASVAAGASGAWVGTAAGLAFVERSASAVGARVPIRDLVLWADTLWMASDVGVLALALPDTVPRRLSLNDARLGRSVLAIARADSVLVLAASTELIEIDLKAQRVLPPRAAPFGRLQGIARITMDARTIWLVGEGGVLAIDRLSGRSVSLPLGLTLSAPPTSVTLASDVAWIGTRNGLVRVRRRADGMPP
jgi:hypothetical protein